MSYTDLEALNNQEIKAVKTEYTPFTTLNISYKSDNTFLILNTPDTEYFLEYRLLLNGEAKKPDNNKIRVHPINSVDMAFILRLHNFTDERYRDFIKERRTQNIDTIFALSDDTPDNGQEFITVEVTRLAGG